MKPMVSVIVVSHDHRHYLNACLSSVMSQRGISIEVILVENASRDGTSQYVREHFPSVAMFRRKRRYGFAANINYGIRKSGGRYILVLNPDTRLYAGAIASLVRRMNASGRIGICGPKLVNPDGSVQMSFRNFPTWKTALFRRTPLRYVFRNPSIVQWHLNSIESHDIARPVDWMLGACLLFRRTMLQKIGLLDEAYRLYVEDVDICLRAHRAGWEVWYEPAARVEHKHEAKSDRSFLSIYSYYHAQSMLHFVRKFWISEFCWDSLRAARRLKHETGYFLRSFMIKRAAYAGAARCPICNWHGGSFIDYDCGGGNIYRNALCPLCRSHPRHRLVCLWLRRFLAKKKTLHLLHVAPEDALQRYIKRQIFIEYLSIDIDAKRATRQENIERLTFPDNTFDVILCLCVLEHVPNDKAAMKELNRVLAPRGICVIDTPVEYSRRTTLESSAIQTTHQRAKMYWQGDHVRLYGRDFVSRLEGAGFIVSSLSSEAFIEKAEAQLFGVSGHNIYFASK